MSETRTASILQRVPVILAVTAASYGLPPNPAGKERTRHGAHGKRAATQKDAACGDRRGRDSRH